MSYVFNVIIANTDDPVPLTVYNRGKRPQGDVLMFIFWVESVKLVSNPPNYQVGK